MPKTILILDSAPAIRRLIQVNLEHQGYGCRFVEAGNLRELNEVLERESVDLGIKIGPFNEDEAAAFRRAKVKTFVLRQPSALLRLKTG